MFETQEVIVPKDSIDGFTKACDMINVDYLKDDTYTGEGAKYFVLCLSNFDLYLIGFMAGSNMALEKIEEPINKLIKKFEEKK